MLFNITAYRANGSGWSWMDEERKARLEKMVATTQLILALIRGVLNVGVVLSRKPILKKN